MKFVNEWEEFKKFCEINDISTKIGESNGVRYFVEAEADYGRDAWIHLLTILDHETPERIPSYD